MSYTQTTDDEFAAFANRAEEEAEAQKNRNSNGGFEPREYDQIKWLGLEESCGHILRIVGRPPVSMKPGSHVDPTDAHEIFITKIKDDNGKVMKLKLPLHSDDEAHEHIMWRIINKAAAVKYRKGPDGKILKDAKGKALKDYIYEGKPWLSKILKGGYVETDKEYQFNRGWAGQQVVIMNVIDREDDWCKENKHTKLLSKQISISKKDGKTEFPFDGVPSYGFMASLSTMVNSYGTWEKYDIQLRRTGQTQPPIDVLEAGLIIGSKTEAKIDKTKKQYISTYEGLTPEELEYERYDIAKMYAPTSYQKIFSRLGKTIKAIDVDLGTNFYEELQALAEQEKKDMEAMHANDAPAQTASAPVEAAPTFVATDDSFDPYSQPIPTSAPVQAPIQESAPVAQPTVAARTVAPAMQNISTLAPSKIALLKGWNIMSQEERDGIADVITTPDGQSVADIVYKDPNWELCSCPLDFGDGRKGCGKNAPGFYTVCPCCGVKF